MRDLLLVSLLGLATTSSSMLGVAIGLYVPLARGLLAGTLAFAAGALISALAIELAFKGALELHHQGFSAGSAWAFVALGFAVGAVIYYAASFVIEKKGGAIRTPSRFREYLQNPGSSESLVAIFCEAIAGGAVLALVAHAMIPEAIHEGGSRIVLPTVAGFLLALYLALASALA